MGWLPQWRARELAGSSAPSQRFARRTKKALVLADISTDRPSHELSSLVLESLGARNAAKIHLQGEGRFQTCTINEFYAHAREEEHLLFPKLLDIAKNKNRNDVLEAVYNLLEDHAKILAWADALNLPWDLIENHGMIEDALIWEFRKELAPELFEREAPEIRVSGESEPAKFLDPWFERDAKYAYKTIPWNPLDWFDAKITREVIADGGARVDAMLAAVNAHADEMAAKKISPINYNAAAWALLGGSQDIGAELSSHAAGFLELESKAREDGRSRMTMAGSIAGSFIGMPWLGTILGKYYDWMENEIIAPFIKSRGGAAGHSDWIVDWYKLITSCFSEMMKKLVVPPFGGTLNFGSLDWEEWQNVKFQTDIVCGYREKWNRMPKGQLETVQAWFAVLAKYARDEQVSKVIMHTTWNPQGMAGDSQVLIVAAPIARLYGFDLREFAAELWDKSAGWSARKDLTHVSEDGTIMDAGVVQWIVLCKDAFELAEDWKAEGKTGKKFSIEKIGEVAASIKDEVKSALGLGAPKPGSSSDPVKPKTNYAPYAFGAVGTGLLAIWSYPIYVSALPVIGGWLYAKKKERERCEAMEQALLAKAPPKPITKAPETSAGLKPGNFMVGKLG